MVDLLLRLVLLLCLLLPGVSQASLLDRSPAPAFSGLVDGTGGQADFLPVAQAFKPGVLAANDQQIRIQFDIAPGYYLYRHRLDFRLTDDSLIRNIVRKSVV